MRRRFDHASRLQRDERIPARAGLPTTWASGGCRVTVSTREDTGVDSDEPWVASCDTHAEMICCPTRRAAIAAARHRDWCSGCRDAARPTVG